MAVLCATTLLIVACQGGEEGGARPPSSPSLPSSNVSTIVPVTPVAKPPRVPAEARATERTTELGQIERRANQPPRAIDTRRLEDASCRDDVMVFNTSKETIYAAWSCDSFWDEDTKKIFLGKEVAIVLEVTEARWRILIETVAGAQGEVTAAGIWVDER